jgi:hypothetical protein
VLRTYLFSLPFLAVLAAMAFFSPAPTADRDARATRVRQTRTRNGKGTGEWRAAVGAGTTVGAGAAVAVVVSCALALALIVIRYGNERFESFTTGELAAVGYVYAHAPRGSRLVAANPSLPWADRDLGRFSMVSRIEPQYLGSGPALLNYLTAKNGRPGYLILTRGQEAYGEMVEGQPKGWTDRVAELTVASSGGRASVVYRNADAVVVQRQATVRQATVRDGATQ